MITWIFVRIALHYQIIIAVFLTKISPKQDFMVNHAYFFYFVTWISLIFLMVSGVFTDIFGSKKLKTLGGIHETRQKKIETSRAPRWARGPSLRPPFVASLLSPASALALGPASVPSGFLKSPLGFGGSGRRSPWKNQNNLYKFTRPGENLKISEGI